MVEIERLSPFSGSYSLPACLFIAIWVSRELLLARVAPPDRTQRIRESNVRLLAGLLAGTLDNIGQKEPAYSDAAAAIRQIIAGLM